MSDSLSESLEKEPEGSEFLASLVDVVASGNPPGPGAVIAVNRFLNRHQAKLDLTQVGLANYHMMNLKKVATAIEVIDQELLPQTGEIISMTVEEKIQLRAELAKELKESSSFLERRASKSLISSPEGMAMVSDPHEATARKNAASRLPPEARQRVRNMATILKQVLMKAREVQEATKEDDD